MMQNGSEQYVDGFIDGLIELTLSSCRNEYGYEMCAHCFPRKELVVKLSELTGSDAEGIRLISSEKTFLEVCSERFGLDRKSRRALLSFQDILLMKFGEFDDFCQLENEAEILENYSGYNGGSAPFYIVSKLFIMLFEENAVVFLIGSDE